MKNMMKEGLLLIGGKMIVLALCTSRTVLARLMNAARFFHYTGSLQKQKLGGRVHLYRYHPNTRAE